MTLQDTCRCEVGGERIDAAGLSVRAVQELLDRGILNDVSQVEPALQARLRHWAKRLRKVRSWGGAYARIRFSEEVEALVEALTVSVDPGPQWVVN